MRLARGCPRARPKKGHRSMVQVLFETDLGTYKRLNQAILETGLTKRAILEAALRDALDKILK